MIKGIGAALTLVLCTMNHLATLDTNTYLNIYTCIYVCNLTRSISNQNQLVTLVLRMIVYIHISIGMCMCHLTTVLRHQSVRN